MNSGLRAVKPSGADDRLYLSASYWGYVGNIVVSPSGRHVAIPQSRIGGFLLIGDALGQMQVITIDSAGWDTPSLLGWSPDGRHLAYHRRTGGGVGLDILTLGGDGGIVDVRARLAGELGCTGSADLRTLNVQLWRWLTPDRIEFIWERCALLDRTFHISADGSGLEEIPPAPRARSWLSPSGSRLLYFTPSTGIAMIARPDSSDARPLSASGAGYYLDDYQRMVNPWSPDETHVILSGRNEQTCVEQPYVLSIDGSREGPLAPEGCWKFQSWSPDGKWIAATRLDAGPGAVIYLFSADGRERRELVVGTNSQYVVDVAWMQAP